MGRRVRGFLLADTLSAFLIVLMILPLCTYCISAFSPLLSADTAVQDEIGAQQLRRMIALSYDIQVSDSEIDLTYRQKAMRLRLSGENVILTPGTQYCFTDVEDCSFHLDGRVIRMVLERENETVEKVLGVLP
jgi:hypothetical protein